MAKLSTGALEFIAQNAMKIFNSEDFLSLSPANLLDTLQLDSLCISEVKYKFYIKKYFMICYFKII
jgi:hypothetical protein